MTLTHTPAHTMNHPDRFEHELTGRGYEVSHDDCAEDPRTWNETKDVALWAYREPSPSGSSVAGTRPEGNVAIDAFAHYYDTYDAQESLALTRRYLAAFHADAKITVETHTVHGYCQSEWLDLVVAVAEGHGTPAGHADTYRQWAFGDVWFVNPDRGQAVGGIYADSAEDAVAQFRAQHDAPFFVRTLTLVIDAADSAKADDVARTIAAAIGDDADEHDLPNGVHAVVTEPVQED